MFKSNGQHGFVAPSTPQSLIHRLKGMSNFPYSVHISNAEIRSRNLYLIATIFGDENISCRAAFTWVIPTSCSSLLPSDATSAISVDRRQMSKARLASPDTAATFLAASCMASSSKAFRPFILDMTIVCSCLNVYGWNVILVRPCRNNESSCSWVWQPPDKSAYLKIIFLISQQKHMLWVLKRTVSIVLAEK